MVKGLSFFLSAAVGREKASTGFLTAIRQQMPLAPGPWLLQSRLQARRRCRRGLHSRIGLCYFCSYMEGDATMRRAPVWTMLLPLMLLAACQSGPQSGSPQATGGRQCPPRLADSGQCNTGSIYVFPELTNVN